MGWTYTYKEPGVSPGKFLEDRGTLSWSSGGLFDSRVLDTAVVNRKTLYAAVEWSYARDFSWIGTKQTKRAGEKDIFALVFLLDYRPNDAYNFGYRDLEESMGPSEDYCPERILKLLTPTESEYANEWRQRCRDNISRRSRISSLQVGDVIEFDSPLSFGKWGQFSRFTVETKSPKLTFGVEGTWASYRIRRENFLRDGYKVIRGGNVIADYSKRAAESQAVEGAHSAEQPSFDEDVAAGLSR